jgi:flagellar basal-body rod protein FlgG
MSIQTLYTAATGMTSLETKLDTIANNLANTETTSYKRARANFEDLFYRQEKLPGAEDNAGQLTATGIAVGLGTRVSSIQTDFKQGAFKNTANSLDLAIEGNGFFKVMDPTGEIVYTRAGNFSLNANGQICLGSAQTGRLLEPPIVIPADAQAIVVSAEGKVSVRQPNTSALTQVGTIELATFINPEGMLKMGENLYAETNSSGTARSLQAGQQGVGVLRQNTLEASNVEPVSELIDLITTQRAFELNSQVVQAGDQIMQLIANLRRA